MIEVRIRLEFEERARRLCDWPATRLSELLPTLTAWGINYDAEDDDVGDLSGGFVVTDSEAFFEVVIGKAVA